MSLILEHIELLVRRHDCVTLPGLGALIVRHRSARFAPGNGDVLLPPERQLAFNGSLRESDGVLERSVARRCGVSYEVASRMVADDAAALGGQLRYFGTLALGRLGHLEMGQEGTVEFFPAPASRWDWSHYGLRPLLLKAAAQSQRPQAVAPGATSASEASAPYIADAPAPWSEPVAPAWEEAQKSSRGRGRFTRVAVGVAASVAVLISLALFFLNPITVDNTPVEASLAPSRSVKTTEVAPTAQSAEIAAPEVPEVGAYAVAEQSAVAETEVDATETVAPVASEAVTSAETVAAAQRGEAPAAAGPRFDEADPFCVIVASFPTADDAARYIAENPGRKLGVLHQDGKYRVYGATAPDYGGAAAQKSLVGREGAWICRR